MSHKRFVLHKDMHDYNKVLRDEGFRSNDSIINYLDSSKTLNNLRHVSKNDYRVDYVNTILYYLYHVYPNPNELNESIIIWLLLNSTEDTLKLFRDEIFKYTEFSYELSPCKSIYYRDIKEQIIIHRKSKKITRVLLYLEFIDFYFSIWYVYMSYIFIYIHYCENKHSHY